MPHRTETCGHPNILSIIDWTGSGKNQVRSQVLGGVVVRLALLSSGLRIDSGHLLHPVLVWEHSRLIAPASRLLRASLQAGTMALSTKAER